MKQITAFFLAFAFLLGALPAFAVSAAFVFGDHLAFSAGYDPEMILPLIAGKLCAGITAVCLALLITKEKKHV